MEVNYSSKPSIKYILWNHSLHLFHFFSWKFTISLHTRIQESVQAPLVILLNASKVNGPLQFIDFWLSFEILAMKMKSDTTVIGTNIRCTPWPTTLIHQDGQYNQSNVKTYQNWLPNFFKCNTLGCQINESTRLAILDFPPAYLHFSTQLD